MVLTVYQLYYLYYYFTINQELLPRSMNDCIERHLLIETNNFMWRRRLWSSLTREPIDSHQVRFTSSMTSSIQSQNSAYIYVLECIYTWAGMEITPVFSWLIPISDWLKFRCIYLWVLVKITMFRHPPSSFIYTCVITMTSLGKGTASQQQITRPKSPPYDLSNKLCTCGRIGVSPMTSWQWQAYDKPMTKWPNRHLLMASLTNLYMWVDLWRVSIFWFYRDKDRKRKRADNRSKKSSDDRNYDEDEDFRIRPPQQKTRSADNSSKASYTYTHWISALAWKLEFHTWAYVMKAIKLRFYQSIFQTQFYLSTSFTFAAQMLLEIMIIHVATDLRRNGSKMKMSCFKNLTLELSSLLSAKCPLCWTDNSDILKNFFIAIFPLTDGKEDTDLRVRVPAAKRDNG